MIKVCKTCNIELTMDNKSGPRLQCKRCRSKSVMAYQAKDLEKRRKKATDWARKIGIVKQYPCLTCSNLCYKKFSNAFCSDICRFLSHVTKTESCWIWTGAKNKAGYGLSSLYSRVMGAHRLSYTLFVGEIHDDLWVLHTCDVPSCVNPEHLWLGTTQDNKKDQIQKDRGGNKLNSEKVMMIRKMYDSDIGSQAIANLFHVTCGVISNIVKRRIWKHICILLSISTPLGACYPWWSLFAKKKVKNTQVVPIKKTNDTINDSVIDLIRFIKENKNKK